MTNADKFKSIFGLYATELWSKSEKEFLEWLNADANLQPNLQLSCNHATDCISRQEAINAVDSEIVSTNPDHFKSSEKFIKFMEDPDISSFGKWQWANGFNTAVVSAELQLKKLPSAQPEPIRINLNESIKVKLTDWGKEIYYHQYDRLNQIAGREVCKPSFPKEDENGCVEFQLWYFMELYGEYMGMAMPNVINPLEIVYKS